MSTPWSSLMTYLSNDDVSELEVVEYDKVFLVRGGERVRAGSPFTSREQYENSLLEVYDYTSQSFAKQRNDKHQALIELPVETVINSTKIAGRCHIVLPPVCETPQVTIAKRSPKFGSISELVAGRSLSPEMGDFISEAVNSRLNIVLSGGTGSGKTTALNAYVSLFNPKERLGVAEDTPELHFPHLPNTSYLRSTPWTPGRKEEDLVRLDWIIAQLNRMRMDRIIVGETRGGEFYNFLTAANSGIDGCLTTLHANSPEQCVEKMIDFALLGAKTTNRRQMANAVASAVHLIVQLSKKNGRYVTESISEVTDTVTEQDKVVTNPLYQFTANGFEQVNLPSDQLRKKLHNWQIKPAGQAKNPVYPPVTESTILGLF